jgi:hypothetical protein
MRLWSIFKRKQIVVACSTPEEQVFALRKDLRERVRAIDQAIVLQAKVVCDMLHEAELQPDNSKAQIQASKAEADYQQLVKSKQSILVGAYRRLKDIQSTLNEARRTEFQALAMESLQEFKLKEALEFDALKQAALLEQDKANGRLRANQVVL